MIKYLLILSIILNSVAFAYEDIRENEQKEKEEDKVETNEDNIVILKDTSGLTDEEVRKKAQKSDKGKEKRVDIQDVIKSIQEASPDGTVNLSEIQALWEDLSPKADKYDWIQTKSGEWFKGEIKSLYRDKLEFDSDEIGLYEFDFDNVTQIKSFHTISVNIEDVAIFQGILRYKDDKVTIIQGDKTYTFPKEKVVSIAPEGKSEFSKWSGKVSISFDTRSGNNDQFDYTSKANIKRLTSENRLTLDYLGRFSKKEGDETANDQRFNEKFDIFITRDFFWTPLFTELYKDEFKNINLQTTVGVGIGWILLNKQGLDWDVSAGPGIIYTKHASVEDGQDDTNKALSFEGSTTFDWDITNDIEFIYNYKFTLSNQETGTYKHHMVTTLENELTDWLDIDVTYVWDFILDPTENADGTSPVSNDNQILVGFGIEF